LALEALWALYDSGGWSDRDFDQVGGHPNEYVRAWAVRFLGDKETTDSAFVFPDLVEKARREMSPAALAQLACTAKKLPPEQCYELVQAFLEKRVVADDAQLAVS